MSKLKVLVLDAVREDAIIDLKNKFDVTIAAGPKNDRKWVLEIWSLLGSATHP